MKIPESNKTNIQIIADECVDKENVDFLLDLGFDVKTTKDLKLDPRIGYKVYEFNDLSYSAKGVLWG